jgi:E3 ubiquitin-protein ligase MUL1
MEKMKEQMETLKLENAKKNKQLQENDNQFEVKKNQLQEKDKQLEELESRLNCVICNERPRDTIFFPCTHFVCCKQCMKRIEDEKCPMCRASIRSHFQTKLTQ